MKRIVIVDDEPDIVEVLADVLSDEGYEVQRANDGREALELIAREDVDLLLADVMMPVMSGAELVRRLRGDSRWSELPIILMSAAPIHDELRAQVAAAFSKPFDLEVMVATVKGLLGEAGERGANT